jgi:flavodoxin
MKTLIVYYSLEGNTAFAAKKMAKFLSADLLELVPQKAYPRTGAGKYLVGGMKASTHEAPKLHAYKTDVKSYDCIILGTPVWASNMAPPLRTFIQETDFSGKKLALFACSKSGNASRCLASMQREMKAGPVSAELSLIDPLQKSTPENDRKIAEFCGKLQ